MLHPNYSELKKRFDILMDGCYEIANEIMISPIRKYTKEDRIIANLFFYSNHQTQDRLCKDYKKEIENNCSILFSLYKNKSHNIEILSNYKENYNIFKGNKERFHRALKKYRLYGYTYDTMLIIFENAIGDLDKGFKKVENNFSVPDINIRNFSQLLNKDASIYD